jgi:hypothetical protein
MATYKIQDLYINLAILKRRGDVTTQGDIKMGCNFLSQRLGVEGEDFEVRVLADVRS